VGEESEFNRTRLTAGAGSPVTVRFKNTSSGQQHNWVLVASVTRNSAASAGTSAGAANGWIRQGDSRIIAKLRLLNPKETGEVHNLGVETKVPNVPPALCPGNVHKIS
jgi:azurin